MAIIIVCSFILTACSPLIGMEGMDSDGSSVVPTAPNGGAEWGSNGEETFDYLESPIHEVDNQLYEVRRNVYEPQNAYNTISMCYPKVFSSNGDSLDQVNEVLFSSAFCGEDFLSSNSANARVDYSVTYFEEHMLSLVYFGYWHDRTYIPLLSGVTIDLQTAEVLKLEDFYVEQKIVDGIRDGNFIAQWSSDAENLSGMANSFSKQEHFFDFYLADGGVFLIVSVLPTMGSKSLLYMEI